MLTVEEVAAIPLFSALQGADLERLARTSADLQLAAGEFAVHEGGEGALFVVISGKIEVIKTFDGVERTLGWRVPGTIFGEVPITLGTPFPGGYRAAETSRVMRIEVQQYYHIAAISKDVAQKINALARERLGGLQAITSEPHKPRVTLIGPPNSTLRSSVVGRLALPRRCTGHPKGFAPLLSSERRPADRPVHRRGSKIISAFRAAYPATSLRAVPFSRQGGWGLKFW